jgi:hypothetical protein
MISDGPPDGGGLNFLIGILTKYGPGCAQKIYDFSGLEELTWKWIREENVTDL